MIEAYFVLVCCVLMISWFITVCCYGRWKCRKCLYTSIHQVQKKIIDMLGNILGKKLDDVEDMLIEMKKNREFSQDSNLKRVVEGYVISSQKVFVNDELVEVLGLMGWDVCKYVLYFPEENVYLWVRGEDEEVFKKLFNVDIDLGDKVRMRFEVDVIKKDEEVVKDE